MTSPVPVSAIDWMGALLMERFGLKVTLQSCGEFTRLFVVGATAYIEIRNQWEVFFTRSESLTYSTWNPSLEGWHAPVDLRTPAPGLDDSCMHQIERIEAGYRLNYDVLSLAAWALSRREEVDSVVLDEHGRFPARASHAFRNGYLDRPVVDEWLEILGQIMVRLWPSLPLRKHSFSLALSHDVDHPSRYGFLSWPRTLRSMAREVLVNRSVVRAAAVPYIRLGSSESLHPLDPLNTFEYIMSASERRGLVSSFYFICGRTAPARDALYEPGHPAIRTLMRQIHRRGHELGLHPSYGTYLRPDLLAAEATTLRRIAEEEGIDQDLWGGRMHFLRWRQPETLRAWEFIRFDYDSTLGYADIPGFRCGTCFEYPALDPVRLERLSIRIRPLIVMECTITHTHYLGLGVSAEALDRFLSLKARCRSVQGTFSLLWHNSELCDPERRALYEGVLDG